MVTDITDGRWHQNLSTPVHPFSSVPITTEVHPFFAIPISHRSDIDSIYSSRIVMTRRTAVKVPPVVEGRGRRGGRDPGPGVARLPEGVIT